MPTLKNLKPPNFTLKGTRKKQKTKKPKPKVNRRQEITKIRADTCDIETKKTTK